MELLLQLMLTYSYIIVGLFGVFYLIYLLFVLFTMPAKLVYEVFFKKFDDDDCLPLGI